jgi:hypothetical protein
MKLVSGPLKERPESRQPIPAADMIGAFDQRGQVHKLLHPDSQFP